MVFSRNDEGTTLAETAMAILVAMIAIASVGGAIFNALAQNKNQGTEQARLTVLAQEKIEELSRLNFGDTTTNTTLITDSGWGQGLLAGGGTNLITDANPSAACSALADKGYVDFLDLDSSPIQNTCATALGSNVGYQRRWQITDIVSLASAEIMGYGTGAKTNFSYTLAVGSVVPKSVSVTATIAGSPALATDKNGDGNLIGGMALAGTINYASGAISITYALPPDNNTPINVAVTAGSQVGLKQISVAVYSLNAVNTGNNQFPKVVLTSLKSQ